MTKSPYHYRSLDSLRGIAAIAVALIHSPEIFGIAGLMPHAYLAVDLFFALSGFILFHNYSNKIIGQNPINFKNYFIARFARLYPLYLIANILGACFVFTSLSIHNVFEKGAWQFLKACVNSMLMLPSFETNFINAANAIFPFSFQSWSIFWEMLVSIIFYFQIKYTKNLEFIIVIIFSFALIFATKNLGKIEQGFDDKYFYIGAIRAFLSFNIGVLIAKNRKFFENFSFRQIIKFSSFFVSILIFYYIGYKKQYFYGVEVFLILIGFPVLIIALIQSQSKIINNKIGDFLGNISYSIYLLHGFFISIITNFLIDYKIVKPSILFGCIWILVLIFIAFLVNLFFEMPMRKIIKNWALQTK